MRQGSEVVPCARPPQDFCTSKYPNGARGAGDVTNLELSTYARSDT
jgi:hypothetical protein